MNKYILSILLISIIAAGIQGYYNINSQTFNEDNSYFTLRQAENILETHQSQRYDQLSYGGKEIYGSNFYWYFIAFLLGLVGVYALNLLPALLILVLPLIVYFLSKKFLAEEPYAWLAAISSAWIPIIWKTLTNTISPLILFIPLTILFFYNYLLLEKQDHTLVILIIITFILGILTPYSLIIVATLLIWHIIMYVENIKINQLRGEATFFVVLFIAFMQFYLYKTPLTQNGPAILSQNIPTKLLEHYFTTLNVFTIIAGIGIVSIIFGVYGVYTSFKKPNEKTALITSFILTILILLVTKLMPLNTGMILLSIGIVLASAQGYEIFFRYISLTKLTKLTKLFYITISLVLMLSLVIPSIYFTTNNTTSSTIDEISLLTSLKETTPLNSIILGNIDEGHLITYFSERKNHIDDHFIGSKDANERYEALTALYNTESAIKAQELVEKYDIDYVLLSLQTQELYNIDTLPYATGNSCFTLMNYTQEGGKLYEYTC